MDAAQAAHEKANGDFKRGQELLAAGVIGRSEFDQTDTAFKIAEANLQAARQALEAAQVAMTHAEIAAPVAGRVIERYAEPGDTATPGAPLLAIYDPGSLRLEAAVRESLVSRLRVGDPIRARIGDSTEIIEGTVSEIVPQAEAGSRTFLVRVDLPASGGLYTGMFGRLLIDAGERERLLVPERAVERIGQLAFVAVVDESGQISRRLATFGPATGDGRLEALSGLREGEAVIVRDSQGPAADG